MSREARHPNVSVLRHCVFSPAKKAGMLILANQGYPNPVRTQVMFQVLTQVAG